MICIYIYTYYFCTDNGPTEVMPSQNPGCFAPRQTFFGEADMNIRHEGGNTMGNTIGNIMEIS